MRPYSTFLPRNRLPLLFAALLFPLLGLGSEREREACSHHLTNLVAEALNFSGIATTLLNQLRKLDLKELETKLGEETNLALKEKPLAYLVLYEKHRAAMTDLDGLTPVEAADWIENCAIKSGAALTKAADISRRLLNSSPTKEQYFIADLISQHEHVEGSSQSLQSKMGRVKFNEPAETAVATNPSRLTERNGALAAFLAHAKILPDSLLYDAKGIRLIHFLAYPNTALLKPHNFTMSGYQDIEITPWDEKSKPDRASNRIPAWVKTAMAQNAMKQGNCFYLSLFFHQLARPPQVVQPAAFKEQLKLNFDKLKPGEQPTKGDVIYFESGSHDHSAIYLGNGLILHKPSYSEDAPPVFDTLSRLEHHVLNWDYPTFYRRKSTIRPAPVAGQR